MPDQFNILDGGPSSVVLGAAELGAVQNTPTLSNIDLLTPIWSMPDASTTSVSGSLFLHSLRPSWATFNLVAEFVNPTAGTGNVRMAHRVIHVSDAGSYNVGSDTSQTVTAAAQDVRHAHTMAAGLTMPTTGQITVIRIQRLGADGADTLAAAFGLVAIRLERAS